MPIKNRFVSANGHTSSVQPRGMNKSVLKEFTVNLVQDAFNEYVRLHGLTDIDMINIEWDRFSKILDRRL